MVENGEVWRGDGVMFFVFSGEVPGGFKNEILSEKKHLM